jgi:hypothetical protein
MVEVDHLHKWLETTKKDQTELKLQMLNVALQLG